MVGITLYLLLTRTQIVKMKSRKGKRDEYEEVEDQSGEEEENSVVEKKPAQVLIISPEVKQLRSRYGLEIRRLAPLFSNHHIKLEHIHLHFDFNRDNKCNSKRFLPSDFSTIKVVAIGISSWSCQGTCSVGVNITSVAKRRYMDSKPYAYVLHPGAYDPRCTDLIFQTRFKNLFNERFPHWTEKDATLNVQEMKQVGRSSGTTYYILDLVGPNACPLAQFKHAMLEAEQGFNSSAGTQTKHLSTPKQYKVPEEEYVSLVNSFKAIVGDTRLVMQDTSTLIEVYPNQANGSYQCSIAFDVYYTSDRH